MSEDATSDYVKCPTFDGKKMESHLVRIDLSEGELGKHQRKEIISLRRKRSIDQFRRIGKYGNSQYSYWEIVGIIQIPSCFIDMTIL